MEASKYESEPWKPHVPAWNQVIQQRALSSGNDPENFPGAIEVGGKLFKKSKEAIQKMLEEEGQDIALWGKGSTGGNYDKGFNPDHPDGTQQLNPFKPGSSLYNQFEKQRELQKMKDMGLVMNSEPWNDTKVAGLFDAIKSGGSGGNVPTTKNKAGVTDAKYVEAGMMTPQQFQDKWGMDPRDYENLPQASAGGNDNNIAQFPTQDLGGLGAKDGDLVAWGKPKGPPPTDAKLGRASDMNVVNWYNSGGDVGSKPEGWTMQDVRDYLNNRDKGFQSSNKKKQTVIATSYDPDGNVIYEAEWMFDKDPLVKKSDAFGKKEGQKTWFKAKDIKPEYPKKKPPKLKNGWHPKSRWHEMSDRAKKIKVSSQDLIRNYKVSPTEVAEYHALVDIINKFIDDNPEKSKMIANRYPFSDPRLAELNFKLDRMMDASESYVDSKFPENKKVTSRIVKILKKNIELTDPETFKMDPTPPTQLDYNKLKLRESATRHFKKPVQLKSWHKGHLTNA
jgi:hypothetical protein